MYRDIIKRAKDLSGFTVQEISDNSGVSTSTINRLLAGSTENPNFDNICAVLSACGYPIENIFNVPDNMNEQSILNLFDKRRDSIAAPYIKLVDQKDHEIALKNKEIAHLASDKKLLRTIAFIALGVSIALMVFICIILLIDLTNTNVGWFRGIFNAFSQMSNGGSYPI